MKFKVCPVPNFNLLVDITNFTFGYLKFINDHIKHDLLLIGVGRGVGGGGGGRPPPII